jgi:hypothetical protein
MYKKEIKTEKFPCDFCFLDTCPLSGDDCPAKKDLKEFFKTITLKRFVMHFKATGNHWSRGFRNLTP